MKHDDVVLEDKRQKWLIVLLFLLRLSSIACFLYSGGILVKQFGPGIWSELTATFKGFKRGVRDRAGMSDPLAMAMREMRAREQFKAGGGANKGRSAASGWGQGKGDDPAQYIGGGKKIETEDLDGGEFDEDSQEAVAVGAGAGGKAGLASKTGSEGGDLKGFDLSRLGAGMGAGQQDANASLERLQKGMKDLSSAAGGSSAAGRRGRMGAGGRSAATSRKTAHNTRQNIQERGRFIGSSAYGVEGARSAVATARRGAFGGAQQAGGHMGAGFGEGTTKDQLGIDDRIVGDTDRGIYDNTIAGPNFDPNASIDPCLKSATKSKECCDKNPGNAVFCGEATVNDPDPNDANIGKIAKWLLISAAIGLALSLTAPLRTAWPAGIFWWAAFATGVGFALKAVTVALEMQGGDSASGAALAKVLQGAAFIPLFLGWGALAFSGKPKPGLWTFISSVGSQLLDMIISSDAQKKFEEAKREQKRTLDSMKNNQG